MIIIIIYGYYVPFVSSPFCISFHCRITAARSSGVAATISPMPCLMRDASISRILLLESELRRDLCIPLSGYPASPQRPVSSANEVHSGGCPTCSWLEKDTPDAFANAFNHACSPRLFVSVDGLCDDTGDALVKLLREFLHTQHCFCKAGYRYRPTVPAARSPPRAPRTVGVSWTIGS